MRSGRVIRWLAREIVVPASTPDPRHSHGAARASRAAANAAISTMIAAAGKLEYSYSTSAVDAASGVDGERTYHWLRDVRLPGRQDPITSRHVVKMIDVDYHIDDFPAHLAEYPVPHVLYTTVPSRPGGRDANSEYWFDNSGEYVSSISGGGLYKHRLWNYHVDGVVVFGGRWYAPKLAYFDVDRVQLSDTRSIVTLVPTLAWSGFKVYLARLVLGFGPEANARRLERLDPRSNGELDGYKFMSMRDSQGVHIGIAGSPVTYTVPHGRDLMYRAFVSGNGVSQKTRASISGVIAANTSLADRSDASEYGHVLASYYMSVPNAPVQLSSQRCIETYQHVQYAPYCADARVAVEAIAAPFGAMPYAPSDSRSNKISGAIGRIVEPHSRAIARVSPSKRLYADMRAFAFLVQTAVGRKLDPVGLDEVARRQARPSQRALVDAYLNGCEREVEANQFVKMEAGAKDSTPRIITDLVQSKVPAARYLYALGDALVSSPLGVCMASSKSAGHVGARVAEICGQASRNALSADANRLDATINELNRVLERMIMHGLFHDQYADEIDAILVNQYGFIIRYPDGLKIATEHSRASGAAETSTFNTLQVLFIAFSAYAKEAVYDYDVAFSRMLRRCVVLGDDSLVVDVDRANLVSSAQAMGQDYTVDEYVPGDGQRVEFLSRSYACAFGASAVNCATFPRVLIKLSTSVRGPQSATMSNSRKFFEKCRSLLVNDGGTPVVSAIARKCMELAPRDWHNEPRIDELWSWYSRSGDAYDSGEHGDHEAYVYAAMPDFDRRGFDTWLETVTSLEMLRDCPGFVINSLQVANEVVLESVGHVTGSNRSAARCIYELAHGTCKNDSCKFTHESPFGRAAAREVKLVERRSARLPPRASAVSGDLADDKQTSPVLATKPAPQITTSWKRDRKNYPPRK